MNVSLRDPRDGLTAFVSIAVAHGCAVEPLADVLLGLPAVSRVYVVDGRWHLVALVHTPHPAAVEELVTGHVRPVPGVRDVEIAVVTGSASKPA